MQKEATYNQLKSIDPGSDAADAFPVIAANTAVVETKGKLADLLADKTRLSTRYPCRTTPRSRSSTSRSRTPARR